MAPGVMVDLRAAQLPGYRDRGVGRWAVSLTRALVDEAPGLVRGIRVDPDLAPAPRLGGLATSGLLTPAAPGGDAGDEGGVLHLMAPYDLGTPVAGLWPPAASARRMRLVVTVYDLIPEVMAGVYLGDPGRRRRYRARHALVRAADAVVTLSEGSATDLVERLGLSPRRVHVVGAACDAAFAPPASRREARAEARRLVAGLGPAWIVYNGAVEARKNMERLVEAYATLPPGLRRRVQLVLACALAPLERNHYEVRARQLGIAGRLVLPGFLADRALALLYQGAELVACPSLYEGYGFPVAEALACGAPVVASDRPALAELVAPGATFDPLEPASIASALARGLGDQAQRAGLLAWAARARPTWAEVAGRVADLHRA
ncbi:MAG: glycosyltransferase family 4 protein, partial [Acidimicrobiales bacterium]